MPERMTLSEARALAEAALVRAGAGADAARSTAAFAHHMRARCAIGAAIAQEGAVLRQARQAMARLADCLSAAEVLENQHDIGVTVADARFAKPLDEALLQQLLQHHQLLITVEEGSQGGFGSLVLHTAHQRGWLDAGKLGTHTPPRLRTLTLPDRFIDHASQAEQLAEAGLDSASIVAAVRQALGG